METGKKRPEENSLSVTSQIIEKINELKLNNHTPLKLEFHSLTYLQILKECDFIKKDGEGYIWSCPGLVETHKNEPNAFYRIPFIINDEGFDWTIISEENNNG